MQNIFELAEIFELRPRPGPLLKPALSSVRGTGHHEMPLADAIIGPDLDKGLPDYHVCPLLPDCF
jgi:hypothetical protein